MICLAPRAPGDSVRPRRLAGAPTRPLNFTVRGQSVRAIAVLAAVVLLVVVACAGAPHLRRLYWQHRMDNELPRGATLAAVDSFFQNAHLKPSYDARSHTLNAIELNASVVSYGIKMHCRFMPNDTLQYCDAAVWEFSL